MKQKGFTLVEIVIVLVIVGLLIGGVLKGKEMIDNANLKRLESDKAAIMVAIYSYQDRYSQLPGDDREASNRFTAYATGGSANNGDGDGAIGLGNDWNQSVATPWIQGRQETLKFFGHLRASGLVPGDAFDASRPINTFGGQIGIQDGALEIADHVAVFGGIESPMARIIDGRVDDASIGTGRVRSQLVATDNMDWDTTPASTPYNDSDNYNMAFRL